MVLDILMPYMTGIEAAAQLRKENDESKIIFLTTSPEFAVHSYKVDAFYYLLKPFLEEELFSLLDKALHSLQAEQSKFVAIKEKAGLKKIPLHMIEYVESVKHNLVFHLRGGQTDVCYAKYKLSDARPYADPDFKRRLPKGEAKLYRSSFLQGEKCVMALVYLFLKAALNAILLVCLTPLISNKRKAIAIIVAGKVFIWLLNYAIYEMRGRVFLEHIFPITAALPDLAWVFLVAKYKGYKALFSLLTANVFGMLNAFLSFFPTLVVHDYLIDSLSNTVCYVLLILFVIKAFRKPYLKILDALEKGWGPLCLVSILMLALIFLLQYYPVPIRDNTQNIPLLALTYGLVFTFYAIIYLNFENITNYYQLKQDQKLILLQTEMQKKEYNAILDKVSAAQIYRHDMRHHIQALYTMLHENKPVEAEKYLGKLSDKINDTAIEQFCENYVVNAILSYYINKAREVGIQVICKANIPTELKIEEMELVTLFSNMLENAVTACESIPDPTARTISIVCRESLGQLHIQITNSYTGEIKFDGEYPVSQREDHGFGTRSIAAIAQKHEGIFSFTAQGGQFVTTVILHAAN